MRMEAGLFHIKSRDQLKKYLHGQGIEIGALHNPLDITGTSVTKVSYVDRMPPDDLYRHYPELREFPLVPVDYIDDGSILTTIADHSQDFIIANHLIEHLANPVMALENWYRKLAPSGILFLAVPDKRFTFDKERPLTTIRHLLDDYYASEEYRLKRDHQHYVEHVEMIMKLAGKEAEEQVAALIAMQYSIHYHVWDFPSFQNFLRALFAEVRIPFKIIDYSRSSSRQQEIIFILGK